MKTVEQFEHLIAEFYNSKYAVATDCCTHAIELCLRYTQANTVTCPKQTYVSVPMTFEKLNLRWNFIDYAWTNYYTIGNTNIIDAAVYWQKNGYINGSFMCLSFQYKKHLNLSKGGMILTDDHTAFLELKKMSYDGRLPNVPWKEQDIELLGYHYYMTPETANLGLAKFKEASERERKIITYSDYPDLSKMRVFDKNVKY